MSAGRGLHRHTHDRGAQRGRDQVPVDSAAHRLLVLERARRGDEDARTEARRHGYGDPSSLKL